MLCCTIVLTEELPLINVTTKFKFLLFKGQLYKVLEAKEFYRVLHLSCAIHGSLRQLSSSLQGVGAYRLSWEPPVGGIERRRCAPLEGQVAFVSGDPGVRDSSPPQPPVRPAVQHVTRVSSEDAASEVLCILQDPGC